MMTLSLEPKPAKVRLIYSRDADKRQALRAYIRGLGYCPDCKLPLSECREHGQVIHLREGPDDPMRNSAAHLAGPRRDRAI